METCELVIDGADINANATVANESKLSDLISRLKHERPLIFEVWLKTKSDLKLRYFELTPKIERVVVKDQFELSLDSCFKGFTVEETLGGDDQWYCSRCKEHVDFTKKLEIYSVPQILCI